jgi:hypothetical protein
VCKYEFLGRKRSPSEKSSKVHFELNPWNLNSELTPEVWRLKLKTQLTCGMFWNTIITQRNNVNSRNLFNPICNRTRYLESQTFTFISNSNFLTTQTQNVRIFITHTKLRQAVTTFQRKSFKNPFPFSWNSTFTKLGACHRNLFYLRPHEDCSLFSYRAVGRSENPGVPVVIRWA